MLNNTERGSSLLSAGTEKSSREKGSEALVLSLFQVTRWPFRSRAPDSGTVNSGLERSPTSASRLCAFVFRAFSKRVIVQTDF